MASSWLDLLPSHERAKIRTRLRSPEEYERLRERVKGPEDLEREMRWNESMAELSFTLETEPGIKESLKQQVEKDLKEQGIEKALEKGAELSPDVKQALEAGKFDIAVETDPETNQEELAVLPEGRVAEKIPVQRSLTEQYVSHLAVAENFITITVQVNRKLCGYLDIAPDVGEDEILEIALSKKVVQDCLDGREVRNHVYVPGEILNLLTE